MHRLLYEKKDEGIYLSNLDLIRLFQRVFTRAGLMLKHSQGFSPKPYVSVAMPLSVGMHSVCEILDFELEGDIPVPEDLPERLNATLPKGIKILQVYDSQRKVREISLLSAKVTMEYDNGVPQGAVEAIRQLFDGGEVVVSKHTKRGDAETDIRPMIRSLEIEESDYELYLNCIVCAQNPSLNPMLLVTAISKYLPELAPDFSWCLRLDILDAEEKSFR